MAADLEAFVQKAFAEAAEVQRASGPALARDLVVAARRIAESLSAGHTLHVFGNGGSAAQAQHCAGELAGRYARTRQPFAAIAHGSDASTTTCIANDFGYEEIFARPLAALGRAGDVALGITTSGRSPNVLRAFAVARERGLFTLALAGSNGDALDSFVDLTLRVPATSTARIQEGHATAVHALTELIEHLCLNLPLE